WWGREGPRDTRVPGGPGARGGKRDVCGKIGGRLSVSPFLCRYSTSKPPADRNTSIGAPCSICRSSVFDGVYTMWTAAPDSRSNNGRRSLNAGFKLGDAPTVRGSARPGFQAPTMAASAARAAITSLNVRMSALNLRKFAGSADDALLHRECENSSQSREINPTPALSPSSRSHHASVHSQDAAGCPARLIRGEI